VGAQQTSPAPGVGLSERRPDDGAGRSISQRASPRRAPR
jgi:hypothetical protein